MVHLATGDYLLDDQVLIERKTVGDLRESLVDGRLFSQVRPTCSQQLPIASPDRRPGTNGGSGSASPLHRRASGQGPRHRRAEGRAHPGARSLMRRSGLTFAVPPGNDLY